MSGDKCNYKSFHHCFNPNNKCEVCDLTHPEKLQSPGKWFTERGSIWRTLENKRLKFEKNGHITTIIKNRKPTKKDERIFEFSHQLPKGNPNLLPGLPKEYLK